jgi:thiol:disulfide interchange protein DsbC
MRRMLTLLLLLAAAAHADGTTARLAKQLGVQERDVAPAAVTGLYRVTLGPQVLYVTVDGKYALRGDLIQLHDGRNLTAEERAAARLAALAAIDAKAMIVFGPPHPKHLLTVLTDIDCTYCRQLADEMPRLAALDVGIRYLAYPRTGVDTPSWDKAMAVWCARDPRVAYLLAMKGKALTPADAGCAPAPVLAGYNFGRKLGMQGTPVIITESGQIIDGYLPAEDLARVLDDPALLASETL